MKKILTILLVVAMLIQSSFAVLAITHQETTDIELFVSDASITVGKTFDLTAAIDMQSVRDKFIAGLALADEYCEGYYADDEVALAAAKANIRDAAIIGTFTLTLTYPDGIKMPNSVTAGSDMDGFNDEAKIVFEEVSRTVADGTLTISIKVKDDVTIGELEADLADYLGDMTIIGEDLVGRSTGTHTIYGALTGTVTSDYNDVVSEIGIPNFDINFVEGSGATVDVAVSYASSGNRPSYRPGYYVPDNDNEERGPEVAVWPFADVNAGDWYYDAVAYTYKNGIFKGTTDTAFDPNAATTRGMIVTLIARIEKISDTAITETPFTDVAANEYYATAIKWAAEHKIVLGYGDGTYGPNDLITREQLAAIWYRYQQYKNAVAAGDADVALTFADAAQISDYAVEAVKFCYNKGIITGKENNRLDPAGNATRAEVATVLMRYLNK